MKQKLRRLTAAFLIAASLVLCMSYTSAEAAPAKPKNVLFKQWDSSDFTAFTIHFKAQQWFDGAQFKLTETNGRVQYLSSHFDEYFTKGMLWTHHFWGFSGNRIYFVYARVYRYNSKGKRVYSAWSRPVITMPSPPKNSVKVSVPDRRKPYIKLNWSKIYGAQGYDVYMTTKPSGKWYYCKSSSSTSIKIKKFRGKNLQTKKTYYVRVVPRRKRGGKNVHVTPLSSSFWNCRFYLSK